MPSQGNNVYIFPGVGLGVLASDARVVTDGMFLAASKALAGEVTENDLSQGLIYPPLERIRTVSASIAYQVAEMAYDANLAKRERPADLLGHIHSLMYEPTYPNYA